MNNYEPPKSKLTQPMNLSDRLISEQSYVATFLASIIGVCGGIIVFVFFTRLVAFPYIVFVAPGFIAGYTTKFIGKAWELKYRAVCGLVVFGVFTIVPVYIWHNPGTGAVLVGITNAAIALFLSKRKLTYDEERAMYKKRMGLDKT